jgi:polysaccharide pyruvyl transferase CsaB
MSCAIPTVLCGNEGFLGLLDSSNMALAASGNFCCRDSELPTSVSLFESISTALEMKENGRRALGEYLRDYVCKHHSSEMLAKKTEAFYLDVISQNTKASGGIILCGYYGFGNLGDNAILAAAISRIRNEYPDKQLSVICHSPKKTALKFGVRTVSREDFLRCANEIKKAQLLIFGGGSVLQNSSSMRSLIYYTSLIRFAAKHGVKIRLLSNGLGPIDGKRAKKCTGHALSLCSSLSFRDKPSAALARSLGCDPSKITLERDLSASLKECEPEDAERLIDICGLKGRSFFLVAIRKSSDKLTKKRIDNEVRALKKGGLLPVFIAMHPSQDARINEKASKRHSGIYIEGLEPAELLTLIKRAEFAIGNRYHLLFLAKNSGVPIQVFGNDPKLISLRYENIASLS